MIFDRVFFKFFISGVINTIAGLTIMFLLYNVAGFGYWFSSAANETLAGIVGFLINKHWTFKVKRWSLFIIAGYFAMIVISYLISYKLALTALSAILVNKSHVIRDNAALFTGLLLFSMINYFGQRFIVFRKRDEQIIFAPILNHREREKGFLVYPVYSRRSGGLSVGINLFPDKKSCQFDCPYCEVFPFSSNAEFSLEQMESDLRAAVESARKKNEPVKDICFSGNGEPTLSPAFPDALKLADTVRAQLSPSAELVVITNGAGLLQPQVFSLLKDAAVSPALNIWLKLDAGTSGWYQKMNRSSIPFEKLIAKIKEFASHAPFTIQTMLCAIDGECPPDDEARAWETLVCELAETAASGKGTIRKVQIYGKARSAPEDPKTSALPETYLEYRASSLRRTFETRGIITPVEVYL